MKHILVNGCEFQVPQATIISQKSKGSYFSLDQLVANLFCQQFKVPETGDHEVSVFMLLLP
jgi:hypothetical protein